MPGPSRDLLARKASPTHLKFSNTLRFLDRLAEKTSKKSTDNDLVVIEWSVEGAVLSLLDMGGAQPKIKRFSRVRFDGNTTESEKQNAYAQFLSTIVAKQRPRTILCWSDGVTFRQISLPEMPHEDLMKAFDWELKKKYYFNPEENLFGYKEAMPVDGEEGPEKLYSVFYCENKVALPRLDFALTLGLDIQAVLPTQAALARFAAVMEPNPEKDSLICELTDVSARILTVRGDRNMLVRNVVLTGTEEGVLTDNVLSRVSEEIRKTIDFYEGQKFARPISKVVFVGAGCETARLLDFMGPKLNVPVLCPVLDNFISGSIDETDKNTVLSHPGILAASMGAALMPDDTLNLVPGDIKTKNRRTKMNRWLNLGLIGLGAVLFIVGSFTALRFQWTTTQIGAYRAEYDKLNESRQVLESLLNRSRVRRVTLKGSVPIYALLKDISLRTPGLIVLRQLQFNRLDDTITLTGELMDAKKESAKTVTQFATSLSESLFFQSATVTRSDQDDENKVIRFEINGVLKGLSV